MDKFPLEFIDALMAAADRMRAEHQEAECSLMTSYRIARRKLSIEQARAVIDTAERRIARLKPPRPRPELSAQALAEIYRRASARALPDEEGQE